MTLKKVCLDCDATWLHGSAEVHRLDCGHHPRKPVRDGWTLSACRERVREMADNPRLSELAIVDDRVQLLALVDELRGYAQHAAGCPPAAGAACDCGLDERLRDIDGASGGGER